MISNTNFDMNFLKLNEAMETYFNKKSLLLRSLEQLLFDSVFLLPICIYFGDTLSDVVIYYLASVFFIYFIYGYLKSSINIFRMKFMRKDAIQFYIKVLQDNDFPKYGEYQMNGSKWLDRILKDTSLPCEKRIAAAELGLIVYNIIGGNGGGIRVQYFEERILADAINEYEGNTNTIL